LGRWGRTAIAHGDRHHGRLDHFHSAQPDRHSRPLRPTR